MRISFVCWTECKSDWTETKGESLSKYPCQNASLEKTWLQQVFPFSLTKLCLFAIDIINNADISPVFFSQRRSNRFFVCVCVLLYQSLNDVRQFYVCVWSFNVSLHYTEQTLIGIEIKWAYNERMCVILRLLCMNMCVKVSYILMSHQNDTFDW